MVDIFKALRAIIIAEYQKGLTEKYRSHKSV
jgi:hypothetical protein